ncbi:MAG TPA: hypothetical protein VI603_19360 [Saprospiraceae bacterium]|nr:hypothetical protein [Saprospiraceae bacterium]
MLQRLITGWTFTRVVYLILGGFLVAQSIWDRQWFGVAIGSYFAAMGLFAFGCATGNCFGGNCEVDRQHKR